MSMVFNGDFDDALIDLKQYLCCPSRFTHRYTYVLRGAISHQKRSFFNIVQKGGVSQIVEVLKVVLYFRYQKCYHWYVSGGYLFA